MFAHLLTIYQANFNMLTLVSSREHTENSIRLQMLEAENKKLQETHEADLVKIHKYEASIVKIHELMDNQVNNNVPTPCQKAMNEPCIIPDILQSIYWLVLIIAMIYLIYRYYQRNY